MVEFGKESINLASDLQEVQNVVDTVFKGSAQEINEFSKTALEAYGLSELSAKKYASTMGAMLDSMQVSDKEMLVMSKTLTALSGDMASFYNLSGDDAFQKIRAGISGETEPLKQLGINMSVANLEAYALSQGITKSYKAMSQNEQAILRYNYLLSVTANAQGDFARTQDGWANQTRILSERFNQLKIVVGDLLINVLTPALKVLNELVSTALTFAQTLSSALGLNQNDTTSTVNSMASSQEDLASATEDATEAQKEQNKAVASFDKLNDISKSSGSSSDKSGTFGMSANSYESSKSDFDTSFISEKLEEILAIVGIACLAIGVILAFTGASLPLGIGLMVVGAASLAAAVAIDNTKIAKDVGSVLDAILVLVSAALLAIGIIIVCFAKTPKLIALGIALIVAGAIGLVASVALNWGAIKNFISKYIDEILLILGASLLVIGAILTFTGVNMPLGIALMIAGVASLATVVAFNWDTIVTKIKSVCDKIKTVVSRFGNEIKTWFTNLINKGIGTFEGFINKIIGGLNWLIAKLNAFKITIPDWIGGDYGGKSLGFNITPFKTVSIPRLATGAVIPARSEFVAVLGDQKHGRNLEAPEGLIRQIVREESSSLTYEDIKSAFFAALLMAKQNGILDFDVNMDGQKVGQRTAKYVGNELNRSGFVFRTVKG